MLNKICVQGRLTSNPELRQTDSGIPICNFTIAVDRPYQKDKENKPDFIPHTAWRGTAEFIYRNFKKGQLIVTEGSIRTSSYTDKDGIKRYLTFVNVDGVHFSGMLKTEDYSLSESNEINDEINPIEGYMGELGENLDE